MPSMTKIVWTKFFWRDWEADTALRACSLAAQGLWMRMLCIAAQHEPVGYVAINGRPLDGQDLAPMVGVSVPEVETLLAELDRNGVFSRDRTRRIYSRRMTRDAKKSAEGRKFAKKRWGKDAEKKEENPKPNGVPTREPNAQKPEARSQSIPSSNEDGPSDEVLLFREGKALLGNSAGGLISKLVKAVDGDHGQALGLIREAAGRENPREWIGAVIRDGPAEVQAGIEAYFERLKAQEQQHGTG